MILASHDPHDAPTSSPDLVAERIYAISLWQPWASLIFATSADGERFKHHETRHWVPKPGFPVKRGSRLIIHAAKTTRGFSDMPDAFARLCYEAFGEGYRDKLPVGAAIGTVTLADWYPAADTAAMHEADRLCGNWSYERFAWLLDDPEQFATPIPMKGQQSFWRVGGESALHEPKAPKPKSEKPAPPKSPQLDLLERA